MNFVWTECQAKLSFLGIAGIGWWPSVISKFLFVGFCMYVHACKAAASQFDGLAINRLWLLVQDEA